MVFGEKDGVVFLILWKKCVCLGGRGYADNKNNMETEGEHKAPSRVFKRSLDGFDALK